MQDIRTITPLEARRRLGVVFFPAFDWAISPTHPEREERLLYTRDQLQEEGLFDIPGISEHRLTPATFAQIERVHFCLPSVRAVCTESHLAAAGGAITAARLVMKKKEDKAFALVRPPGHHAMRVSHGNRGFCNINNEAVMVEYIRDHYPHPDGRPLRIAIVDTDVHHGDGTEAILANLPEFRFFSLFQWPLFPYSRMEPTPANVVTTPLAAGAEGHVLSDVVEHIWLPALEAFRPQLILVSAGFDAHVEEHMAQLKAAEIDYARMSRRLVQAAAELCEGRIVSVLEGGYAVRSLARSVFTHVQALLRGA